MAIRFCQKCGKQFSDMNDYDYHINTYMCKKDCKCYQCYQVFARKDIAIRHIKGCDNVIKPCPTINNSVNTTTNSNNTTIGTGGALNSNIISGNVINGAVIEKIINIVPFDEMGMGDLTVMELKEILASDKNCFVEIFKRLNCNNPRYHNIYYRCGFEDDAVVYLSTGLKRESITKILFTFIRNQKDIIQQIVDNSAIFLGTDVFTSGTRPREILRTFDDMKSNINSAHRNIGISLAKNGLDLRAPGLVIYNKYDGCEEYDRMPKPLQKKIIQVEPIYKTELQNEKSHTTTNVTPHSIKKLTVVNNNDSDSDTDKKSNDSKSGKKQHIEKSKNNNDSDSDNDKKSNDSKSGKKQYIEKSKNNNDSDSDNDKKSNDGKSGKKQHIEKSKNNNSSNKKITVFAVESSDDSDKKSKDGKSGNKKSTNVSSNKKSNSIGQSEKPQKKKLIIESDDDNSEKTLNDKKLPKDKRCKK